MRKLKSSKLILAVGETSEAEISEQEESREGILAVSPSHQAMLQKEHQCLDEEFSGSDCVANHIMFGLHQLSHFLVAEHNRGRANCLKSKKR